MLITNVEQSEEKSIKEPHLPKTGDVMSQKDEQKVTPSSTTADQVARLEQVEKTKEERTRTKSAPEVAPGEKVDSSRQQDQLTDSKKTNNVSLDVGEDTTDGGEQGKRRSSLKDGRTGSLNVRPHKVHICILDLFLNFMYVQ